MHQQDASCSVVACAEAESTPSGEGAPLISSERIKVVVLVRALGATGGGAERVARQLLVGLDSDRYERILCVSRPLALHDRRSQLTLAELQQCGVRVEFLRRSAKYSPFGWWPLYRQLRRERVDILHSHSFGQNAWGVAIARLARVPVIVAHVHGCARDLGPADGHGLQRLVNRHVIARGAHTVAVVSQADLRRMVEVERIPRDRLSLLTNGIEGQLPGDGSVVRTRSGIGRDDPVIGTVCILRPEKALDVLIRASALVMRDFPRLWVLIAGDGPARTQLTQLVHVLGLEERVLMLGTRNDVPDLLAALDIVVLSSDSEGMPLAVLEFMEAGKPIVATSVGGVPEMIEDGVHGVLVRPRDEVGLARAIGDLLGNPERATEMGARARERRRREFDSARTVERLEQLYERLLHAARRNS